MVQYGRLYLFRYPSAVAPRMAGTLFIVATPIGNLEDITLRALRVLREVDLIAAEDTRRTAKLLNHYEIRTPTTSFHEHNERHKTPALVRQLCDGSAIALVSDAGTPLVSDPGTRLVQAALEAGCRVEVIPGASAVLAALVMTGYPSEAFTFAGFVPHRSNDRRKWLSSLAQEQRTLVFFEAPHRIRGTLEAALEVWGDRDIALCREVTKIYEELVKGPISDVLRCLQTEKGEFTVVVPPVKHTAKAEAPARSDVEIYTEFCDYTEKRGLLRRAAILELASKFGVPARAIYAALERAKREIDSVNRLKHL